MIIIYFWSRQINDISQWPETFKQPWLVMIGNFVIDIHILIGQCKVPDYRVSILK